MRFGGMERWQSRMRDVDAAFRETVRSAWAHCRKGFASDSHEDHISAKLVVLLRRQRARAIPYNIEYQSSDPVLDRTGAPFIRVRHDIRVIFALGDDDAALIYECKRLNVVREGKKSTSNNLSTRHSRVDCATPLRLNHLLLPL